MNKDRNPGRRALYWSTRPRSAYPARKHLSPRTLTRGTETFLIRCAFSNTDVLPMAHASVKSPELEKVRGTKQHNTDSGTFLSWGLSEDLSENERQDSHHDLWV